MTGAAAITTVLLAEEQGLLGECLAFGRRLVETQDLDPVYTCLVGARLPEPQLCRLLVAYWCFYHLGAAAWLSEHEGDDYWRWMSDAAANEYLAPPTGTRWPRSAERRHFRGPKCVEAVNRLSHRTAEDRVRELAALRTEREVMDVVSGWYLFGSWIAYKVPDMLERVYGVPIAFSKDTVLLYDEPRRALELLETEDAFAYEGLLLGLSGLRAPPTGDRRCGPAETETVLCKWKSTRGNHYHVGKDIREVRHGLAGWGETAARLLAAAPEEVA